MVTQIKAGARKGQSHYKRTRAGSIILPNGDRISINEQKAFRSAINYANRKRKKLIADLPKEALSRYLDFGIDSDFVARHKSSSFARFRNKKEFNRYLKAVRKINSRGYLDSVVDTYRKNLNKAIDDTFNSLGKPLKEFIKTLSNRELRELTLDDSFKDIGYVYYEPVAVAKKLKVLTEQIKAIRAREAMTGYKDKRGRI